ncbi:MAG TPA: ABC transporter ATP-binding protein [Gemmatimonadaceae bacterium]
MPASRVVGNANRPHTVATATAYALRALRSHPWLAAAFLTTTLAQGALQGLLVWALREVLLAFGHRATESTAAILVMSAALIFAIWVARAACTAIAEICAARLAHGAEVDAMARILEKLLTLSVRFFDKSSQGDLVMATYSDAQHIRLVTLNVGNVVLHVTRLMGLAAVAWLMSPKLALVGLIAVPLGAWPAMLLGKRVQEGARSERGAIRNFYDSFLQVSTGIRIIKVNTAESRVLARAREVGAKLFGYLVAQAQAKSIARFLLEAVSGFGLIAILVIGGRDVAAGTLQWQSLLSLLIAIMGVYSPTVGILLVYNGLQTSIPHLERIERIMSLTSDVRDRTDAVPLRRAPEVIELRDVSFAYDDQMVLDGISATFRRGETIGIVGASGAGKSTLMALLLRLYDPTRGQILLDGIDLRELRHADYLRACAIVMQEPFLFLDTVANNIRSTRVDAPMADVIAAARAANIHDEIEAMEHGYDTMVGRAEDARGISVGQKQRVCIASALLKNAPLLFLDEATSNLDSVSERVLQSAIERLMEGRTTFVIAHRLSTLRAADRILVLEQGRMVGLGTHEELLRRCPTYHRLWRYQSIDTVIDEPAVAVGAD